MSFRSIDRKSQAPISDALEHLWDYSYLGTHPLTKLHCIAQHLPSPNVAHLEYGRTQSPVLAQSNAHARYISEGTDYRLAPKYVQVDILAIETHQHIPFVGNFTWR